MLLLLITHISISQHGGNRLNDWFTLLRTLHSSQASQKVMMPSQGVFPLETWFLSESNNLQMNALLRSLPLPPPHSKPNTLRLHSYVLKKFKKWFEEPLHTTTLPWLVPIQTKLRSSMWMMAVQYPDTIDTIDTIIDTIVARVQMTLELWGRQGRENSGYLSSIMEYTIYPSVPTRFFRAMCDAGSMSA